MVTITFDKKKSCGYYFNNVTIPDDVSIITYDYDSKIADDKDASGKPCKIVIYKKMHDTIYQIEIFVKNKQVFKTKIPQGITLNIRE